jgi:hypothetical protein
MSNVTFPADVRAKLHRLATQPCSLVLPGFVPYVATEWDDSKIAWAKMDDSATSNPARYSYDPVTQLVPRYGTVATTKKTAKKTTKRSTSPDIAVSNPQIDISSIVARLPTERMSIKQARQWQVNNKLTDAQRELVGALASLADNIAAKTGVGKYHLDELEAKSVAIDYLILAVVAGPAGDVLKFVRSKIKNGLRMASAKRKLEREHFTSLTEERQLAECRRKLLIKKEVNERDQTSQLYEDVKSNCENPTEHNVALLVMDGATMDRIAIDLKLTRCDVLEIVRRLAA